MFSKAKRVSCWFQASRKINCKSKQLQGEFFCYKVLFDPFVNIMMFALILQSFSFSCRVEGFTKCSRKQLFLSIVPCYEVVLRYFLFCLHLTALSKNIFRFPVAKNQLLPGIQDGVKVCDFNVNLVYLANIVEILTFQLVSLKNCLAKIIYKVRLAFDGRVYT